MGLKERRERRWAEEIRELKVWLDEIEKLALKGEDTMNGLMKRVMNLETTLLGVFSGGAFYLTMNGVKFPTTQQEWGVFIVSALIAGLGGAAKDGKTGSQPQ